MCRVGLAIGLPVLLVGCLVTYACGDGPVPKSGAGQSAEAGMPSSAGPSDGTHIDTSTPSVDWADLTNEGASRYTELKDLHDASLTTEQRAAWVWSESLKLGNPYAVEILQKAILDSSLRNGYVAIRRGSSDDPNPRPEEITHQRVISEQLLWPLIKGSEEPWPIFWQGTGSSAVPRIEIADPGIPLFGSQACDWEFGVSCSFTPEVVQEYGPQAAIDPGSLFPNHDAVLARVQQVFGVLDLYVTQFGMPQLPDVALRSMHFAINQAMEKELHEAYTKIQFVKRADDSAYGLLLEDIGGRRHFIKRELSGQSGYLPLGLLPEHQREIAMLLSDFEVWQEFEQLDVPRVEIQVPDRKTKEPQNAES